MESKPPLRERVRRHLRTRNMSLRAEEAYVQRQTDYVCSAVSSPAKASCYQHFVPNGTTDCAIRCRATNISSLTGRSMVCSLSCYRYFVPNGTTDGVGCCHATVILSLAGRLMVLVGRRVEMQRLEIAFARSLAG